MRTLLLVLFCDFFTYPMNESSDQKSHTDDEEPIEHVAQLIAYAQKYTINPKDYLFEKDEWGYALLHRAAEEVDVESMRFCLQHGADVHERVPGRLRDDSALDIAISHALGTPKMNALPALMELMFFHGHKVSLHWCSLCMRSLRIYSAEQAVQDQCQKLLNKQLEQLSIAK